MIKRNSEGLYDTISGLQVHSMTQHFFDEMNSSEEKIQEYIKMLTKGPYRIEYFVYQPDGINYKILCHSRMGKFKTWGDYYDKWEDIPEEIRNNHIKE